jgi:hypothetical protein
MDEDPEAVVFRGAGPPPTNRRPYVEIRHRGCLLRIRFAEEDDTGGEGPLASVELLPDREQLDTTALQKFIPMAGLYLSHARAALRLLGGEDFGTAAERLDTYKRSMVPLRQLGGPGRPLPDDFFRRIADSYRELVADGEKHPVKAIAKLNSVTIGAASRWVKGARDRGFLLPKGQE